MIEWGMTSTILIIAVLVLRGVLRGKISFRLQYALWLLVLVRLLVPVTLFPSSWSVLNVIPDRDIQTGEITTEGQHNGQSAVISQKPSYQTGVSWNNVSLVGENGEDNDSSGHNVMDGISSNVMNGINSDGTDGISDDVISGIAGDPDGNGENIGIHVASQWASFGNILRILWLIGAMVVLSIVLWNNYCFYRSLLKNRKKISQSIYTELEVYHVTGIQSPCLFGIMNPAIYLDQEAIGKVRKDGSFYHVLTHEYTHYRHGDHLFAVLRVIAVALHWYNPLVWYGAYVSVRDCELACDEGTIARLGEEQRLSYGETLIQMIAVGRGLSNICSVATTMVDGKKSIKERIQSIAVRSGQYAWAILLVGVVVLVAFLCLFSGRKAEENGHLDISRKELKKALIEAGNYESTGMLKKGSLDFEVYEADYDKDGVTEAFVLVPMAEDGAVDGVDKRVVDLWYYDDVHGFELYYSAMSIGTEDTFYVMNLTDKSFFVHKTAHGGYDGVNTADDGKQEYVYGKSRVLGIQEDRIIDYFTDPNQINLIKGDILQYDGDDLWLRIANYNQFFSYEEYIYYGEAYQTKKIRYRADLDCFREYPVVAMTRGQVCRLTYGEDAIREVMSQYPKYGTSFSYARQDDRLIIMVEVRKEELQSCNRYHAYELQNNEVGSCVEIGNGFYEITDEESEENVDELKRSVSEDINTLVQDMKRGYSGSIFQGEMLGIRSLVDDTDEKITLWYYEKTDVGDFAVCREDYDYETTEDGIRVTRADVGKFYEKITSLEEFKEAFYYNGGQEYPGIPKEDAYLVMPNYCDNGMLNEIVHEHRDEYYDPKTAAVAFYHLEGGQFTKDKESSPDVGGLCNLRELCYTFSDQSRIDLMMYQTYQGVWLPYTQDDYGPQFDTECSSVRSMMQHSWFLGLTEEDYAKARPVSELDQMFRENPKDCPDTIMLLKEFPDLGIRIYSDSFREDKDKNALVVEYRGQRHLFHYAWAREYGEDGVRFGVYDYDRDGELEIALITCVGHGTGAYMEEVAIIDSRYEPMDTLIRQNNDEVLLDVKYHLCGSVTGTGVNVELWDVDPTLHGVMAIVDRDGTELESQEIGFVCTTGILHYDLGENGIITAQAQLGIPWNQSVMPYFLEELYTAGKSPMDSVMVDIKYDGQGHFTRENYRFGAGNREVSDYDSSTKLEYHETPFYYHEGVVAVDSMSNQ
ncbi:MAG: M56 family metallopeptidase [Lachnospiraceae bacterium]